VLVFTAFHKTTKSWFVVSSEESVERSWTLLVDSLAEDHQGPLMDHIAAHGAEGFDFEVWGEADSAGDARELVREAQAELGAQVQGMPRKQTKKAGLSLDQIKSLLSEANDDVKPKAESKPVTDKKSAKADGGRDEMHQVMVAIEARRLSMKKSAADKRRAEARKSARKTKPAIPQRTGDEKMDELLARLDQRAASASRRT